MDLSRVVWRKSSHSEGNGGDCVELGVWCKSGQSGNGGEDCVEVATIKPTTSTLLLIRDSKHPAGPKLAFSGSAWTAFIAQIKADALDLTN